MKILLTSYYYKPHVGGIENSLFNLAKVYREMGYEVAFAASDSGANGERLIGEENIDGFKIYRFKNYNPQIAVLKIFKYQIDTKECIAFFKKLPFKPDIIITRNHVTGYAAIKAGFKNIRYIIPGVVKIQDREFTAAVGSRKISSTLKDIVIKKVLLNYLEDLQSRLLRDAVSIIAFSKNMVSQILQVEPGVRDKIKVSKPGIDPAYFDNAPSKKAIREQLNITDNKFVYLILSRLVRQKSIDLAIKAFKKTNNPDAILLIVGDGSEENTLRELVSNLGLQEQVIFMGKSNNPSFFYAAADVYLLPSTHETFGQTILEALYAGIPLVAFDSNEPGIATATSELVDKNMAVLTRFNIDDYAKGMQFIKDNYQNFIIDKQAVASKYSWKNLAKDCIDG